MNWDVELYDIWNSFYTRNYQYYMDCSFCSANSLLYYCTAASSLSLPEVIIVNKYKLPNTNVLYLNKCAIVLHIYTWAIVSIVLMQKWISWALSGLFRYLNAIQTMCPHILRYLTTAVITNKDVRKRRQVLKDLVKVIQQVRTEICFFLFIFLYWDYNFNVPVLGLLTYFSPNSVTEFFVHCEVKCILFTGRAK